MQQDFSFFLLYILLFIFPAPFIPWYPVPWLPTWVLWTLVPDYWQHQACSELSHSAAPWQKPVFLISGFQHCSPGWATGTIIFGKTMCSDSYHTSNSLPILPSPLWQKWELKPPLLLSLNNRFGDHQIIMWGPPWPKWREKRSTKGCWACSCYAPARAGCST